MLRGFWPVHAAQKADDMSHECMQLKPANHPASREIFAAKKVLLDVTCHQSLQKIYEMYFRRSQI